MDQLFDVILIGGGAAATSAARTYFAVNAMCPCGEPILCFIVTILRLETASTFDITILSKSIMPYLKPF